MHGIFHLEIECKDTDNYPIDKIFREKNPNLTMELIDRIKQIIEFKQLSVSGFEKKISASDGVIRRAIRNNSDIYSRFLVEISDKFPDISAEWLLREEGGMLRENSENHHTESEKHHDTDLILGLTQQISELSRENGQLQAEIANLKKERALPAATAEDATVSVASA